MDKKVLATFSTDWHIKDDNTEHIIDLVTQQCELNKKLDCPTMICLGDVFNSRKSQTLLVLNTFGRILDIIDSYKLKLYCISGNHDKTNYDSKESFLDQFQYHPALRLNGLLGGIPFRNSNIFLHFIPFFSNDLWIEKVEELMINHEISSTSTSIQHILCSHIAVQGSQNNDGTKVESSIKPSLFKDFYKVFLGHYHNKQQINSNIFHLPSLQQNNFGEDEDKGFTILYSDGSHELVKSNFKPYRKVKIDVDKASKKEINEVIREYEKEAQNAYIRFELIGSEEKLKAIDKDQFLSVGIDVKTKSSEIGIIEDFDTVEVTQYNDENIVQEFEQFCEEKGYDFENGIKYLK